MIGAAAPSPYLCWLGQVLGRPPLAGRAEGTPRPLVIGAAWGYGAELVLPFVRSLRAHYDGPAVLFVDQSVEVHGLLEAYEIEARVCQTPTGWRPHPAVGRFAAFDVELERQNTTGPVLITDVRDVVFQGDPFAEPVDDLEVFDESDQGRLADHAFNMKHLCGLMGSSIVEGIADRQSLCVGTIVGRGEAVRRLCRLILTLGAIPRAAVGGAFGADQAAFNLAIHLGLVPATIRENYSRVATIGLTPGDRLDLLEGARIANPDGGISPIVHQYDRHPHLAAAVHERWGSDAHRCARKKPRGAAPRLARWQESIRRRMPEAR